MFIIYHSNQLDLLKTLAAAIITGHPLRDPLQPEIILVQSNGMAQWIKIELAAQLGIAANVDCPLPASFIWQMFTRISPEIPDENVFTKSTMTWQLMTLLPSLCQHPSFSVINDYLGDKTDKRKCFQFAAKIADLFDQYLIYRPDWLESWENGELIEGMSETQEWQATLWRALIAKTENTGKLLFHRANFYQHFIQTLKKSQTRLIGLPDRVFICGISEIPPIYLQVLKALSHHIDIHLLFTNPCRYYWGDIQDHTFLSRLLHRRRQHYQKQTEQALFRRPEQANVLFNEIGEQQIGNPLLASWGKQGRDTLYLLAQMEDIMEIDAFVESTENNLLSLIKRDILMLEDHTESDMNFRLLAEKSIGKRLLLPEDHSLSLHVCHSSFREVEVLHDCLLAMIAEDPTLQPRDIIVMAADIDHYTPAIQAVFSNFCKDHCLPFTISDRLAQNLHPILVTILNLLELPRSRFASEEVLTLLEVPAIAARFSINEQELELLRQWVDESGIRWGLDENTLSELMLPSNSQHTWKFGLMRMLLGYAMEGSSGEWKGIVPYDESSGLVAGLIGQLGEFLMQLRKWRDKLIQPRFLKDWIGCIREITEDFFVLNLENEAALALLETQWQELLKYGLQVGYDQPVSVTILHDELVSLLNKERVSQNFLTGSINFCTLVPMRSIPFRVVCLLGMNDGVYPRTLSLTGFDLMVQYPRRGDRNYRDSDRYLFLEALISAQQHFYISFIGRNIQDNMLRCPSVLVSELSDYITKSFYLPGDEKIDVVNSADRVRAHLWQWHTRMPFDPENFLPNGKYQSFAEGWMPTASDSNNLKSDFASSLIELPYKKTIMLDELMRFYYHSVRAWFVQRLAISFPQTSLKLSTNEPFFIDSATQYSLNKKLVNTLINNGNIDQLFSQTRSAGLLPYGAFGELYWAQQCQNMAELVERIRMWRLPEMHNLEINIILEDVTLSGWLTHVQQNGLLRWRPSALSNRDGLLLWLEHLVYCAMGGTGESRIFGILGEWHFLSIPSDQAKVFLLSFVSGYHQGMTSPLLLLPYSGGAWLKHCYDQKRRCIDWGESRQKQARNKLIQAWYGNAKVPGESKDPYLQRLIRHLDQQDIEIIISVAEQYLMPLFNFNVFQTKKL